MTELTEGIELALGGVLRICAQCSKPFAQYHRRTEQHLCPACIDLRDSRPSVVIERTLITLIEGVRIANLPADWQPFTADPERDEGCYRISLKGEQYGATWSGRLVLYAPRVIGRGEVVRLRHMRAAHQVQAIYHEHATSPFTQLKGGPASTTTRERIAITAEDPAAQTEIDRYEYVVLEPTPGSAAAYELIWAEADTKTTLKGYGRQYWAAITGAPLWELRIGGGLRSGRAHTTGVLAVVDTEHPLIIHGTGDIQYTHRWPAEAAMPTD